MSFLALSFPFPRVGYLYECGLLPFYSISSDPPGILRIVGGGKLLEAFEGGGVGSGSRGKRTNLADRRMGKNSAETKAWSGSLELDPDESSSGLVVGVVLGQAERAALMAFEKGGGRRRMRIVRREGSHEGGPWDEDCERKWREAVESDFTTTEKSGIAYTDYFAPGSASKLALRRVLNMRAATRAILANGLVDWETTGELFDIFFKYVSPFVSLLDPVLHTSKTSTNGTRSSSLSQSHLVTSPSRPGLHITAMYFAKHAAAIAFINGVKSVEMAQAYLLMSVYGLPARWEEDRSWFYGGLASRFPSTAPLSERHERERLNRAWTWLNCFNFDRSSSTQWGNPTGIQEDEAIRGAKAWYRGSKYNHPYDVHLVAYTELLKIVSRFHESIHTPSGTSPDFRAITETTEAEIKGWHDSVKWSYENESDRNDPANFVRLEGVPVFENYMRLVMYSFGFEDAWKRHGLEPGDMFFAKCLQSAIAVVRHLSEVYAPSGFLIAFLLKMLRPEFATLLDEESRKRIVALVTGFVDVLASPKASIDERHAPKLYAKFLHGQLRFVTIKVPLFPSKSKSNDISIRWHPTTQTHPQKAMYSPQPAVILRQSPTSSNRPIHPPTPSQADSHPFPRQI
ncbi:hypothetical protein BU17DRAFT_68054 [Hysterangium stoloniferum]|nr:hypothetical protein BU17DRAFT_68054 [Hysterangium stoloniferum]